MKYSIEQFTLENWNKIAEDAHLVCFNEARPREMNTFDYAIAAINEKGTIAGYATIIEYDKYHAYMQHGGAFPDTPKFHVPGTYGALVDWLSDRYECITTRIRNTNTPMLKLAMGVGFLINGIDSYPSEGTIYLHLAKERQKGE